MSGNRRFDRYWRTLKAQNGSMRFNNSIALGWTIEQIVVIDSDLGQSGASAADREGFQKLVADVGMGKAGIVLGLEVSRLARNSTDWHRLLEICALADTLILDEDGIGEGFPQARAAFSPGAPDMAFIKMICTGLN